MILDREASSFLGARWIQHLIHDVHGLWNVGLTDSDAPLSRKSWICKDSKAFQASGVSVLLQLSGKDGGARKLLFTQAGSEYQHVCLQ
jgi:hypothetical protein